MPERPCALHEGGTRQNRCGSLGPGPPGHLGLVCLDLVLYQRHSAFALSLLKKRMIAVRLVDTRQAYDWAIMNALCYAAALLTSRRHVSSQCEADSFKLPCPLAFPVGCQDSLMYVQITELASQLALLRLSLARVPPSQHTQLEDAADCAHLFQAII